MFLSPEVVSGWTETHLRARNGSGGFPSAFTSSPVPSTSLAVTAQSPVLGDELQGPRVLAQLGAVDLCCTSNSRAGFLFTPCPQDGDVSPLPLHECMPRSISLYNLALRNLRFFPFWLTHTTEHLNKLCTQGHFVTCVSVSLPPIPYPPCPQQCCTAYLWCCTAHRRNIRGKDEPPAVPLRSGASTCQSGLRRRCTGALVGRRVEG